MNFKKLMIVVVALVALIVVFKFATRVDRSSAVAVANAFTKAVKNRDTSTASKYVMPDQAEAWKSKIDDKVDHMHSGTLDSFYERIPADLGYTSVAVAGGKSIVTTADKSITVEMTQVDGKWYVNKSTLD